MRGTPRTAGGETPPLLRFAQNDTVGGAWKWNGGSDVGIKGSRGQQPIRVRVLTVGDTVGVFALFVRILPPRFCELSTFPVSS